MKFIERAFKELCHDKELNRIKLDRIISVTYSGKFSPYNASVHYTPLKMEFRLSKLWRGVDDDIKIGLIQSLLVKVLNEQWRKTEKMELYSLFLKNIAIAAPRIHSNPQLVESFSRVNEKYFYGQMDMPNLKWGRHSRSKLGSYEYGSDTVLISKILANASDEVIDYVIFHELLHKKHKFNHKNGKSYHHTKRFREEERMFENYADVEKNLKKHASRHRLCNFLSWF